MEPRCPALQAGSLLPELPGKPCSRYKLGVLQARKKTPEWLGSDGKGGDGLR